MFDREIQNNKIDVYPSLKLQSQPTAWIELDTALLKNNALQLRRIIPAHGFLAFVVKANAYGHGLAEVSKMVENIDTINWLCVFSGKEALEIRNAGCTKPILILGPLEINPKFIINQNIACMVDSIEQVNSLSTAAQNYNTHIPVHVKIDTGLSRFGVKPTGAEAFVKYISGCKGIQLQGIYTHFAESDNPDLTFTNHQVSLFNTALKKLQNAGINIPYVHATNSAGLFALDTSKYNFFRVGLGLYGLFPGPHIKEQIQKRYPDFNLQPFLQLKAQIVALKQIDAEHYVSYKRTCQVTRPTLLGIIGVGYSDGYSMQLSNKGKVLIDTISVPILGRVAMNAIIIDVTDVPGIKIGTEVTLLGNMPAVHPETMASIAEIDNVRALFTAFSGHIPRHIVNL
jgi:alanine racemase